METVLSKVQCRITQLYVQISEMFKGKVLNCKAHISIFRVQRLLKAWSAIEQRPATPTQVKGSHKNRKNATNGKHVLLFKKEQNLKKKSPLKHKKWAQCWVPDSKDTFTAPSVQFQINRPTDWLPMHWFECGSRNKNCLYFPPSP